MRKTFNRKGKEISVSVPGADSIEKEIAAAFKEAIGPEANNHKAGTSQHALYLHAALGFCMGRGLDHENARRLAIELTAYSPKEDMADVLTGFGYQVRMSTAVPGGGIGTHHPNNLRLAFDPDGSWLHYDSGFGSRQIKAGKGASDLYNHLSKYHSK